MFYRNSKNSYDERIKEIPSVFSKYEFFRKVDPNEMTKDQLFKLGFQMWDEDSGLMLIPLYVYPFLKDEIICGSISDICARLIKVSEIDLDHHFGCLAYGVFK